MVNILYEDKDIIVVEKPYGVSSQTERGSASDMVSILMNYLHENGAKVPYVGVVHRLDKNVGGVMVYGKNKMAAGKLCGQISGRDVVKKYYAAVFDGDKLSSEGIMYDMLIKDGRQNMSRVAKSGEKDAKKAELEYRVISEAEYEGKKITYVDITLLTGRHHQIRVQFASRGCPLVGDRKYGMSHNTDMQVRNVGLYCYSLSFAHPSTGKKLTFTKEPDSEIFMFKPEP